MDSRETWENALLKIELTVIRKLKRKKNNECKRNKYIEFLQTRVLYRNLIVVKKYYFEKILLLILI